MKLCPICKTTFPDDANFCPMDAGKLVPAPSASAAPSGGSDGASGAVAGRFHLGNQLGGHATGPVFRADDATAHKPCAVKLLAPGVIPTPVVAQRVERELRQLQKVGSDRIAKVLDTGRHGDRMYVAMELLQGTPLRDLVAQNGPLPLTRALRLASEIGEALAEAAKMGVVHRDVAPKNVLLAAGDHVKMINFALPVPISDKVAGVPEFMSPEQAEGKPVDQRSNIYGLGALLYYMLVGEPPFAGDAAHLIQQHVSTPPVPPSQRRPNLHIPADLDKVILKALEKSSSKRHLTLRQLLSELEAVGAAAQSAPPTPAPRSAPAAMTLMGIPGNFNLPGFPPAAPPLAEGPKTDVMPTAPEAASAAHAGEMMSTLRGSNAPVAPAVFDAVAMAQTAHAPSPLYTPPPAMPPMAAAPQYAATIMSSGLPPGAGLPPPAALPISSAPLSSPPVVAVPPPVVSPPAPAVFVPVASAAPAGGKGKGKAPAAQPAAPQKGKFRETMWFKKGELDEAAAAAAAAAPRSGDAPPISDKADELPMEDRYKDDGTLTANDRERLSLRTGATQMMTAVKVPVGAVPGEKMAESELVGEMRGGRTKILALIIGGLLFVGAMVTYFVASGGKKDTKPAAMAPDAAAIPKELLDLPPSKDSPAPLPAKTAPTPPPATNRGH
jgi:serine/threonine-protein kinase